MKGCYDCFAENGLHGTGIRTLCEYCMSKIEDEFYLKAQIEVLKETLELFIAKYNPKEIQKEDE